MPLTLVKPFRLMVRKWLKYLESTNVHKLDGEVVKDVSTTLRPEAARIEVVFNQMQNTILNNEELGKLASTHSFKLLADLEDKRLKFDKNYIYNKFGDPNPDKGSFKKWKSHSLHSENKDVENETICNNLNLVSNIMYSLKL